MTDDQLVRLVQETPPEELSADQLDLLRRRLPFSNDLRQAIQEQLRLEQLLNRALGRYGVDVSAVIERAVRLRRRRQLIALLSAAAVIGLLFVGGYQVAWRGNANDDGTVASLPLKPITRPGDGADKTTKPAMMPIELDEPPMPVEPTAPKQPSVAAAQAAGDGAATAPWAEMLARPVRPIRQAVFDELGFDTSGRLPEQLARWWQPLSGSQQPAARRRVNGLSMRGRFRLLAPWTAGTVLRLNVGQPSSFQLHCWSGQQGVTLAYFEKPNLGWAAYRATRGGDQPMPESLALAAHDEQRFARLGRGVVDLRYQGGQLLLTRGDVMLLAAPLAADVREVVLDSGKDTAFLANIELVRSEPFPLPATHDSPASPAADKPAWLTSLPDATKWTIDNDGSLALSAATTDREARVWRPLAVSGITEVVAQLDSTTTQTGIYLGDSEGKPRCGIALVSVPKARGVAFNFTRSFDIKAELKLSGDRQPIEPSASQPIWLKLSIAGGAVRCAVSSDGKTWSRMFEPLRESQAKIGSIGLLCTAGRGERRLNIKHLEIRRTQPLNLFVDQPTRARASEVAPASGTLAQWYQVTSKARPEATAADAWQLACAVESLAAGADGALGLPLSMGLLEAIDTSRLSAADRLRQLDSLGQLLDLGVGALAIRWLDAYTSVALAAAEQGEPQPYSLIAPQLVATTHAISNTQSLFADRLIRRELLSLVVRDDWEQIHQLARRLHFFGGRSFADGARGHPEDRLPLDREQTMRLADWAAALAMRNLPDEKLTEPRTAATVPTNWRHPLIEQLGKESFNVLADFEAAVSGGALRDACQVLNHLSQQQLDGLIPRKRDPDWLTPLPEAVAAIMRDQPALRQTMEQEFGSVAQLRFRQSMNEADADTVELVALQFPGTAAAAEAHLWLGDRALAAGDAQQAERYYHLADDESLAARRGDVQWRHQLALAALGQASASAPSTPLALGDETLAADDARRLVDQLYQAARGLSTAGDSSLGNVGADSQVPAPFAFQVQEIVKLDGSVGDKPQAVQRNDVDAFGLQLTVTVAADRLLINNRFQISAFDANNGQRLWSTAPTAPGSASWLMLTAMKPAVHANRVYARRITTAGAELACMDLNDGQLLWKTPDTLQAASDPFPLGASMVIVTASWPQADTVQLSLTRLNAQTGNVELESPLLQLRDVWKHETPCHAAIKDDLLVVTAGGAVVATSLDGQLRWLRRQTWTGGMLDAKTQAWRSQPPLILGNQVISTQPGVPLVSCIESETGQLRWQRIEFDVLSMQRLGERALLVQCRERLLACSLDDGELLWQCPLPGESHTAIADAKRVLLVSQAINSKTQLAATWLDASSGQPIATCTLNEPKGDRPACSVLIPHRGQLFGLATADRREPQRVLIRFAPSNDATLQLANQLPPAWHAVTLPTAQNAANK